MAAFLLAQAGHVDRRDSDYVRCEAAGRERRAALRTKAVEQAGPTEPCCTDAAEKLERAEAGPGKAVG
jgi:hypothetical protein